MIGIGYWPTAVCGDTPAAVARAIRHAIGVVGDEHVALGSDFDGAVTTPFDTSRLEATPAHDLASNLIYSMNGRMARDVLVDGEILVRNGKLTCMDEQALVRDHRHRGKPEGRV